MNIHLMIDSIYNNYYLKEIKKQGKIKENLFIVIYYDKLKYFSDEFKNDIVIVKRKSNIFYKSSEYYSILNYIGKKDKIYIHYLSTEFVWIVLASRANEYYWSLWGGDFYPYCKIELYEKEVLSMINNKSSIRLRDKIKEYVSLSLRKMAIKKINYMLTWNNYDYELVKNNFKTKAEFNYFVYPNVNNYELLDRININKEENKRKVVIQVGNSGDPTNNHFEVLNMLSKYSSEDIKVIAPLSYGDKEYIQKVMNRGFEIFGNKFEPITEYVSVDKYYRQLSSIDIAIMNHYRQQGAGNIVSLLYLGKKIYLNEKVTTYKTYIDWGLNIYPIKDIEKLNLNEFKELSEYNISVNRSIIKKKYYNEIIL